MNNKAFAAMIFSCVTWSGACFSQTCYTVEGKVDTINVPETTQIGTIELLLLDEEDNEAFRGTGDLIGTITGGNLFLAYLSHTANFGEGDLFTTSDDEARVTGVRKLLKDGTPCSFFIQEKITKIVQGSGFFTNATEVEVHADGYVSTCIADGENENEFELTGYLCTD